MVKSSSKTRNMISADRWNSVKSISLTHTHTAFLNLS